MTSTTTTSSSLSLSSSNNNNNNTTSRSSFRTEFQRSIDLERQADRAYNNNNKNSNRNNNDDEPVSEVSVEDVYRQVVKIRQRLFFLDPQHHEKQQDQPSGGDVVIVQHYQSKLNRRSFGNWQRSAYRTGIKDIAKGIHLEKQRQHRSQQHDDGDDHYNNKNNDDDDIISEVVTNVQRAIELEEPILGRHHPHIVELQHKLIVLTMKDKDVDTNQQ